MSPFDVTPIEVLAAMLTALGGVGLAMIEQRRARDDAAHRERTTALEVHVAELIERMDMLEEADEDDEPATPPTPTPRKRSR